VNHYTTTLGIRHFADEKQLQYFKHTKRLARTRIARRASESTFFGGGGWEEAHLITQNTMVQSGTGSHIERKELARN
jgi:hypothetical protein